jgi:hypothetical protein
MTLYAEQDDEIKAAVCGDNVRMRLRGVEEDVRNHFKFISYLFLWI